MLNLKTPLFLCCLFLTPSITWSDGFQDDFSNPDLKDRQALRGQWQYADGVASCTSDPELYKKFKNHGPILRWPAKFTNGTMEFEFKPSQCQRVVITFNEEGHVFRMSLSEDSSRIFGWIGRSSKENKPKLITSEGVPTLSSLNDSWVKGKLVLKGNKANVTIGDFDADLEHDSIGRKKGEFTISFAFGECSVRNVRLTTTD